MRRLHLFDFVPFIVLSFFFLFLALFIFRNIFAGSCLTGTDSMSTIYGPTMQMTYGTYFSAWDYFSSAGFLAYPSPSLAATNQFFLGTLQISASDFAKFILLSSFWLSGMISFYVLRHMARSDLAALVGSFVYVANGAFVNQIVEGHFGFIFSYPFLILIFFLFYEAYKKGISKKTLLLPPLLLLFGGAAAPHMVLLASLMLLGFMIFELLTAKLLGRFEKGPYKIALSISLVLLLVFPLVYILLFLGDSSVLQTSYTLDDAANGSSNVLTALSIGGSEYTNTYAYYGIEGGQWLLGITQILAVPLFIFALLSVFVRKYWTLTIPLLVMIALNMFMAMGPHQVFGGIFTFIFENVPLINSFRSLSRFLLLNAMFYSILITITVANWGEISGRLSDLARAFVRSINQSWSESSRLRLSSTISATLVGLLIISSLSGIIIMSNGEVIRSFDPPKEYTEPFEYVATLESNGLAYKIFTLPMTTDIYQHPSIPSITGYSYPLGTTLDPGTYLPGIIDKSPMAHSTYSINFWSGIKTSLDNRIYGYKDTLALLGASAGVKYVVEQFYADESERELFTEMNNGTALKAYASGAQVIEVNDFSGTIKAQNGLIIGTGGLDAMYILLGMGAFEPQNNTYASINELKDGTNALLEACSLMVIQNGDLFETAYQTGLMDGDLLHLVNEVDPHRGNVWNQWIIKVDSGTQETRVSTSGNNNLTVFPHRNVEGTTALMVRALFGPQQGNLHVYVNGAMISNTSLQAPYTGMDWLSVEIPAGTERIESITFGGSADDLPCEISDAALVSKERQDQLRLGLEALLEPYASKIGYVFTPLYIYNHDPEALLWYGTDGNGVMSLNRTTISIPFESLFDDHYVLSVLAPDWGTRDAVMDGHSYNTSPYSSGAYSYDLPSITNGSHTMEVLADGIYGIALLPGLDLHISKPEVTYHRVSPTEYHITVSNASGQFLVKFSEGSSKFWALDAEDGGHSTWFRADYLANGFLVNGTGDLDLILHFTRQKEYDIFLNIYLMAIITSTAVIIAIYIILRKKGRVP